MGESLKLSDMFFQDAVRFIRELESLTEMMQQTPDNTELLKNAFRAAHSIKSESSYLNFEDIAKACNRLENILEQCKKDGYTDEMIQTITSSIHSVEELVEERKRKYRENSVSTAPSGTGKQVEQGKSFQFTPFEQQLIAEARERNENLYRLYCEIEPSEKMIYPRIFLLINNLELQVNVIKTIPEINEAIEPSHEIQIIFASSLSEEEIYKIVSIDQISRIQLTQLNYNSIFTVKPKIKKEKKSFPEPPIFRVESKKFEELKNGVEEVEHLSRKLFTDAQLTYLKDDPSIKKISELSTHIGRVLQRLYLISIQTELNRLKQFAVELADKLGKRIQVVVSGSDFEIDSRILDVLSDVLVHLVRNAVDHGIEEIKEREMFQKSDPGMLVLTGFKYEDQAIIQIIDDGKGIELEEIREQANDLGLETEDGASQDLLGLLSHPGFTTKSIATDDSGRGYGLDVATKKLQEVPHSAMRVTSKAGRGTIFTIIVPAGYTNIRLLVAKHSNRQICFQMDYVKSFEQAHTEKFSAGNDEKLLYLNQPVFTEHGRITKAETLPKERFVIELEYLERNGYILVDEILFEKEIFERQIRKEREVEPHLYALPIADSADYFVVSPSLILHA